MESNHYAKTPGGGVTLSPAVIPEPQPQSLTLSPCQHINGKGHRCSMFSSNPNSTLCAHHIRKQMKARRLKHEAAANELLDNVGDFTNADSVNLFLGNLVIQLAHKRIARRDALALAYISQLLLNSLSAIHRERTSEREDGDVSGYLFNFLRKRDTEDQTTPAQNRQPQAEHTNGDHTNRPEGKSH
jgi:hypothetical protein